jgi:3-hydroxyacyl-[acyl-carrier-protein] dehydratase
MLIEGFYEIIKTEEKENNEFVTSVRFNKDHQIYKAHFPGNPITPGVCIIQILKDIGCIRFSKTLVFDQISNLKFLNVINPLDTTEVDFFVKWIIEEKSIKVNVVVKDSDKVYTKISGFLNEL